MTDRHKQFGLTLTELLVTMAIAAVLMAVGIPAARRLAGSLQEAAGASKLIAAALSNARAIAVREGRYAGVRFQKSDVDGRIYLVYIIHDPATTNRANGFRPADGRKPVVLPEGTNLDVFPDNYFSIVFNSAGKLVIHEVRFVGKLPMMKVVSTDDGTDKMSVNSFKIYEKGSDTVFKAYMVSPYTGELIGEQ